MKDFDTLRSQREQRERTFKIAGHEFRFRPALPAHSYSLYLELMDKMSEGRWPEGSFDTLNGTILALLEPDYHDLWGQVIDESSDNPVSFEDLSDIIDYCVSVQTGRPTKPPSVSTVSGGNGSTRLTDVSDSPEPLAQPSSI